MLKQFSVILIPLIALVGCFSSDPYSLGDDEITLTQLDDSSLYIDELNRVWAIVQSRKIDKLKAVPNNNDCLREVFNPFDDSIEKRQSDSFSVSDYVLIDNLCHRRQVPSTNYSFNRDSNQEIDL